MLSKLLFLSPQLWLPVLLNIKLKGSCVNHKEFKEGVVKDFNLDEGSVTVDFNGKVETVHSSELEILQSKDSININKNRFTNRFLLY